MAEHALYLLGSLVPGDLPADVDPMSVLAEVQTLAPLIESKGSDANFYISSVTIMSGVVAALTVAALVMTLSFVRFLLLRECPLLESCRGVEQQLTARGLQSLNGTHKRVPRISKLRSKLRSSLKKEKQTVASMLGPRVSSYLRQQVVENVISNPSVQGLAIMLCSAWPRTSASPFLSC